jgi:hypothetical protein
MKYKPKILRRMGKGKKVEEEEGRTERESDGTESHVMVLAR